MVLDFLEELAAQPCGKTVPEAFLNTMAFMERVAGVPSGERLSKHVAVQRAVEQITCQLETGAAPPRKARPQPLMLLIALELWVMETSVPRYCRALAWVKLVKFWTSSRSDDLAGLVPSSLQLNSRGLCGMLQRTKTTGPGKKVKWLPIFVDIEASFAGVPWLVTGFQLWQEDGMNFDRDYLLPLPAKDRQSCVPYMADYAATCALSKELYGDLMHPTFAEGIWSLTSERLLITQASCRAWTEHSERCWMTSVAAALGMAREERDFLGRWRISSCSDEYIRTAQRIVSQLQCSIISKVIADRDRSLKDIGTQELELHLREAQVSQELIIQQLLRFKVPCTWSRPGAPIEVVAPQSPVVAISSEGLDTAQRGSCLAECVPDKTVFKYFICVTKNRRLRRLHRWSGCGTKPNAQVLDFEGHDDLQGVQYDAACKHCWKGGKQPGVAVDSGSSSDSSSSSESTDGSMLDAD